MGFTPEEKKAYAIKQAEIKQEKQWDKFTNDLKNADIIINMAIGDLIKAISARDAVDDEIESYLKQLDVDDRKYKKKPIDTTKHGGQTKDKYINKISTEFDIINKQTNEKTKGKFIAKIERGQHD